jgi:PAS domain S-box-containing protein
MIHPFRWKIGTKIKTTIISLILVILGLFAVVLILISKMHQAEKKVALGYNLKLNTLECRREEKNIIIRGVVDENIAKWEAAYKQVVYSSDEIMQKYCKHYTKESGEGRSIKSYGDTFYKLIKDLRAKGKLEDSELRGYDQKFILYGRSIIHLADHFVEMMSLMQQRIERGIFFVLIIAFMIGVSLPVILGYMSLKALNKSEARRDALEEQLQTDTIDLSVCLSEIFEVMKKMSLGDLTGILSLKTDNELLLKLGGLINQVSANMQVISNDYQTAAIGLCEHYEVLDQIASGVLTIRAREDSSNELVAKMGVLINKEVGKLVELITIVEQKEILLRREKDKIQKYLDTAAVMMLAINREGEVILANKKSCEVLGCQEQEILGKNWFDHFIPQDLKHKVRGVFDALIRGELKEFEYFENQVLSKDKEAKLIAWHNTVLRDQDGEIMATLGSGEDVTQRKKMEKGLLSLNESFLNFSPEPSENIKKLVSLCGDILGADCALYNHIDKGMLVSMGMWNVPADYNPSDKPQGHICYDVITRDKDEVFIARGLLDSEYAETDPNVKKYGLRTYIGHPVKLHNKFVGSLCAVYQKDFNPDEHDQRFLGILAAAVGVEEERLDALRELQLTYEKLKRSQEKLIQAEKLEAIGTMASGVAHEVKNPLGIILQGIDYFESEVPVEKKDQRQTLEMMKNSVKRADKIIHALLDFSRDEHLKLEEQDINPVLRNSVELVHYRLVLNNIEVVYELGAGLPKAMLDKGKLEQVFINLFNNAVDAMPKGGRIYLRSYVLTLDKLGGNVGNRRSDIFKLGEKIVVVEVEDTGGGMEEEVKKKIFDPFFTTKKRTEGTGLGLSVSKSIIEMHRGSIEVESLFGKGTKFILKFKLPGGF